MRGAIGTYYQLTKPGIIYGNILTATAGFLLASSLAKQVDIWLGIATLVSIGLIIGSACVFNNYIDRGIDKKMARTKKRALASGAISGKSALAFGALLGAAGFALLSAYTNTLTVGLGILAMIMYVVVYGIVKRRSPLGTLVGSVSGALPPTAGYTAVSGNLDGAAVLVFLILTFWQMPHFYAIALYRQKEYAAAGIPVWPIKKGAQSTKGQILGFIALFTLTNIFMTAMGYTGYTYLVVMSLVGLAWFWRGLQGFRTTDDNSWAKGIFLFSLIVLLVLSIMMALGALLP